MTTANEYVGAPENLVGPIHLGAEPQGHSPLCASRVGGECACGEFDRQNKELPTVTLEELRQGSHELLAFPKDELNDHSSAREASQIMKDLGFE